MTPEDKAIIAEWYRNVDGEIRIGLIRTEDDRGKQIQTFCEDLSRLAPGIRIEQEESDGEQLPEISIGQNISYQAVPSGRELAPFLDVLSDRAALAGKLPLSVREALSQVRVPAMLRVYIAPQCPFCPRAVTLLLALAAPEGLIYLTVIDGTLFSERAENDHVRSVPTVILDDQFRWTGAIQLEELVHMMLTRDPSRLGTDSLRKIIEQGDAAGLAQMMMESGKIYPAFLDLLIHEKWQIRLGAMVAFEYLAEERKEMASQVIVPLWDRFSGVNDQVKGDILYVLGESKDPSVIPKLKSVSNGPYSGEVLEAAIEALEKFS
ncbi:MAG: thioredoxin family protein [Candidatus Syntrophoarchaeum sp.]|nr:thioredoxin family protein [Candidatus Syntrophoarchaeum sp.]